MGRFGQRLHVFGEHQLVRRDDVLACAQRAEDIVQRRLFAADDLDDGFDLIVAQDVVKGKRREHTQFGNFTANQNSLDFEAAVPGELFAHAGTDRSNAQQSDFHGKIRLSSVL